MTTELKLPKPWAFCYYCGLHVNICRCDKRRIEDERLINEKAVAAMRNERNALYGGRSTSVAVRPLRAEDV